jgi:UDP:flavonoid glycosyltransferase YjiC (YdhE family)
VGLSCTPEGPERLEPAAIRTAVRRLLAEDGFRVQAMRMRAEIEAMPGPDVAARVVEQLVAGHGLL